MTPSHSRPVRGSEKKWRFLFSYRCPCDIQDGGRACVSKIKLPLENVWCFLHSWVPGHPASMFSSPPAQPSKQWFLSTPTAPLLFQLGIPSSPLHAGLSSAVSVQTGVRGCPPPPGGCSALPAPLTYHYRNSPGFPPHPCQLLTERFERREGQVTLIHTCPFKGHAALRIGAASAGGRNAGLESEVLTLIPGLPSALP